MFLILSGIFGSLWLLLALYCYLFISTVCFSVEVKGKQLVYIKDKLNKHFPAAVVPLTHNQNTNTNTFSNMLHITAVVPFAHKKMQIQIHFQTCYILQLWCPSPTITFPASVCCSALWLWLGAPVLISTFKKKMLTMLLVITTTKH